MGVLARGWRVVSNVSTAVWFYQVAPSAAAAALTAVWAVLSGMPPVVVAVLALGAFAAVMVIARHAPPILQRIKSSRSPIRVLDRVLADCVPLTTTLGTPIPDGYAVSLRLLVFNRRTDGATLRNLEVRVHMLDGKWIRLPIRGANDGVINLRHGETTEAELGTVLYRVPEGQNLPAPYRGGGEKRAIEPEEFRCNSIPKAGGDHAILRLSNAIEPPRTSIGNGIGREFRLRVVVSADDVISRTLWIGVAINPDTQTKDWVRFHEGADDGRA